MNKEAACLSDEELATATGGGYISLEEFIKENKLDAAKIEKDPKYCKTVMLAYGLVNYTAGIHDAGSRKPS